MGFLIDDSGYGADSSGLIGKHNCESRKKRVVSFGSMTLDLADFMSAVSGKFQPK
jgi:hypothetical protein